MRPATAAVAALSVAVLALVAGPRLVSDDASSSDPPARDIPPGAAHPSSVTGGEQGVVDTVVDGDTIHLEGGARVRLVQIDAPESFPHEECWGADAKAALRARVKPGDTVTLEVDPRLDAEDGNGRQLRYVHHEGELLNHWLVAEGHAHPYFFRGDRGRHATDLLAAAEAARSERRGLWGACPKATLNPGRGA